MDALCSALVAVAAVAAALLAGVYFAFSTFVMEALGSLDGRAGADAMRAINRVILRSPFMPLFFGGPLAGIAAAVLALLQWPAAAAVAVVTGAVAVCAASLVVTVARNVPLNQALEAAADDGWRAYAGPWTTWNHVRTAGCALAAAAFCAGLALR